MASRVARDLQQRTATSARSTNERSRSQHSPYLHTVASYSEVACQRASSHVGASREGFVDMDSEFRYWQQFYRDNEHDRYRTQNFEPAIRLGVDAFVRARGRPLYQIEQELRQSYERTCGDHSLDWRQARPIVEAVLRRLSRQYNRASR
jgi:hypothetical protein